MAWVKAKKGIHQLDALSKLLASLVHIKTQRDAIQVLGQVNMLKPTELRVPVTAKKEDVE